jgi:hypothetical protein
MKAKKTVLNRTYYKWTFATFNVSSSLQEFSVPTGTKKLIVDCVASKGADYSDTIKGANGGRVQCTLPITAPTTLYVYVGAIPSANNVAEYNASDIRTDNTGVLDTTSLSSRLIVAGGGGSVGSNASSTAGAGGGLIGGDGTGGNFNGKGGTQSAGGAAGDNSSYAHAGSFGLGGTNTRNTDALGAGGAGWYGGGSAGGTSGHSGGGGSSYTDPSCKAITHTQGYNNGTGYVKITYAVVSTPDDYDFYEEEAKYSLINKPLGNNPVYYGIKSLSRGEVYNPISPVGYTVVGSPTIQNGIVSGFSQVNYIKSKSHPTEQIMSFEENIRFSIPTETMTTSPYIMSYNTNIYGGVSNLVGGFVLSSAGNQLSVFLFRKSDNTYTTYRVNYNFLSHKGEFFTANVVTDMNNVLITLYDSEMNVAGTASATEQNLSAVITSDIYFGAMTSGAPAHFTGKIDLNNTYIKINNTIWFRGDIRRIYGN